MPSFFLEFLHDPVDDALIDIVAAKVSVPIGCLDFDDAFANFQNRDIERTAAEIVDRNDLVLLLVQAICQSRSRWLINDTEYIQPGDLACVLGRLALSIIEVRRNGDDRLINLLSQIVLSGRLQFLKNHRGNLRRRIFLARNVDADISVLSLPYLVGHHFHFFVHFFETPAHESLDRIDRVFSVRHSLTFGYLPGQAFATFGKRHHGRRCASAFLVGNDNRLSTLHYCDNGVGRAEINTDNLAHRLTPPAASDCFMITFVTIKSECPHVNIILYMT